jgi:maltose-binding protein MalE
MKMYRVVLYVFAAVLLLAGCAPQTASLRPLVAPKPTEGLVVYVSGEVQASSGGSWIDVEPGDSVGPGTVLRTGGDGSCELQFGDTISVRIEAGTEFRCDSVAIDERASVRGGLTGGAILAKVQRLSGADLQVDTPSTVIGVRGTAFKVSVSGTTTKLTVREGTVSVTQEGATLDVGAGLRAVASPGTAIAEQPAADDDLAAIDAFVPAALDTSDAKKLVKVVVVVEPTDAEIWMGSTLVGRGTWGALYGEGVAITLLLRRDGFEDDVVYLPEKSGKPVRIARKLTPLPAQGMPTEPASPEAATVPGEATAAAPVELPAPEIESSLAAAVEPSAEPRPPAEPPPTAGLNLSFRVDPALGNDPFFREMAERFAQRVPRFALVTGPASANLDAPAWPRGADLVGGIASEETFTYERLPQLVAAKLVRPLDGWFEWTQLAPVLVDAVRMGGRVYGLPVGGCSPILYYNRELVREPPRAWSDITALAAEYAQKGEDALALACLDPFFMGMFPESRDLPLLVPDGTRTALGSPRAVAVYDAMREALVQSATSADISRGDAQARFRGRHAALLVHSSWSFGLLHNTLGDSLGVAVLPSWGSPPVELAPYVDVLALFVSTGVSDERAAVLRRFFTFLLEQESQLRLVDERLARGSPLAPARRFYGDGQARFQERHEVVSVLYRQLETARPMPRGRLAEDSWRVFSEVLSGIREQRGGEVLARMADARFLLYGLERKPMPAGARELRAVIDPAPRSQGLYFRPWDEESDLRLVEAGGSLGVVSLRDKFLPPEVGDMSYLDLVLNYDPYRGGRAPELRGRIEYFDEPNAALRVVYDSKDTSVRENPNDPDSWGAWKQAASITCTGTRQWKTAEFLVPDARFDRRCNGADVRIEVVTKGVTRRAPPVRSVVLTPAR